MSERTKGMIEYMGHPGGMVEYLWPCNRYDPQYAVALPHGRTPEQKAANTKHLADCWNACEGYEGELTPGLLAELAAEVERLRDLCDKASQ